MLKVLAIVIVAALNTGGTASQVLIGKEGASMEQCEVAAGKIAKIVKEQSTEIVAVTTTCVEVNLPSVAASND